MKSGMKDVFYLFLVLSMLVVTTLGSMCLIMKVEHSLKMKEMERRFELMREAPGCQGWPCSEEEK